MTTELPAPQAQSNVAARHNITLRDVPAGEQGSTTQNFAAAQIKIQPFENVALDSDDEDEDEDEEDEQGRMTDILAVYTLYHYRVLKALK